MNMDTQSQGNDKPHKCLAETGEKRGKDKGVFCRDEESCMHCGVCTVMCPTEALRVNLTTRYVEHFPEKCTACGQCVKICPVKALSIEPDNGQ